MNDLRFWQRFTSWEEAEEAWDENALNASKENSLKGLKSLPQMPGITEDTAENLKWKSLKYMLSHDEGGKVRRQIYKHPIKYAFNFVQSVCKKRAYKREGDFFFYGIESEEAFQELLKEKDTLLVLGFSYCHKPFECPSGRFTSECIHDVEHPVCQQCFIGKAIHALPEKNCIPLAIPTVHYIGEKVLETVHAHPEKRVIFIITACEMTLEMFGDWGNMAGIQGIGVRLDGRICNTMKAFELSERGVKPGLTVVLEDTKQQILNLLKIRRSLSE